MECLHLFGSEIAKPFLKGADRKHFILVGHSVSAMSAQLCHCGGGLVGTVSCGRAPVTPYVQKQEAALWAGGGGLLT